MALVVIDKGGDAQNTLLITGSSLPHDDVNGRWYNPCFHHKEPSFSEETRTGQSATFGSKQHATRLGADRQATVQAGKVS
jgi:hypothetical protein